MHPKYFWKKNTQKGWVFWKGVFCGKSIASTHGHLRVQTGKHQSSVLMKNIQWAKGWMPVLCLVCQSFFCLSWVWPRNSDHQEYSMFSRESRHKPSFTTIRSWEGGAETQSLSKKRWRKLKTAFGIPIKNIHIDIRCFVPNVGSNQFQVILRWFFSLKKRPGEAAQVRYLARGWVLGGF